MISQVRRLTEPTSRNVRLRKSASPSSLCKIAAFVAEACTWLRCTACWLHSLEEQRLLCRTRIRCPGLAGLRTFAVGNLCNSTRLWASDRYGPQHVVSNCSGSLSMLALRYTSDGIFCNSECAQPVCSSRRRHRAFEHIQVVSGTNTKHSNTWNTRLSHC